MSRTSRRDLLLPTAALAGLLAVSGTAVAQIENPANGHYYGLIDSSRNWTDSAADAEALILTAEPDFLCHLVTITSEDEQDFIDGEISYSLVWIGLSQDSGASEPSGGWEWVTGESVSFDGWEGGEPNDSDNNEDCGEMSSAGWNDLRCSDDRPFIYECEPAVHALPAVPHWGHLLLLAVLLVGSLALIKRHARAS